jgi:hypothetical protein
LPEISVVKNPRLLATDYHFGRITDVGILVGHIVGFDVDEAVYIPHWLKDKFLSTYKIAALIGQSGELLLKRHGDSGYNIGKVKRLSTTLPTEGQCDESQLVAELAKLGIAVTRTRTLTSGQRKVRSTAWVPTLAKAVGMPLDTAIVFCWLEWQGWEWQRKTRLHKEAEHARDAIFYNVRASLLARGYTHLADDPFSIAECKRKKTRNQAKENELSDKTRQYANIAAPGRLRAILKAWLTLADVPTTMYTSITCPHCHTINHQITDADGKVKMKKVFECKHCKGEWDRDREASVLHLNMGYQTLASSRVEIENPGLLATHVG